jgi:hypothetical protein
VLRGSPLFATRYPRIHDFDVYFSFRTSEQTYCVDYETIVLDEIKDLASCDGKDVEAALDLRKKRVVLHTPQNRTLKARLVPMSQCSPATLAQTLNP